MDSADSEWLMWSWFSDFYIDVLCTYLYNIPTLNKNDFKWLLDLSFTRDMSTTMNTKSKLTLTIHYYNNYFKIKNTIHVYFLCSLFRQ